MAKTVYFTHCADCPYLGEPHSIEIKYAELQLLGKDSPSHKALSYSCDMSDSCPYPEQDIYGRCPVFLSAPNEPC